MSDTIARNIAGPPPIQAPPKATRGGTPQFLFSSHYSGIGPTSKQASLERVLGAIFFHLVGIVAIWAVLKYTPAGSMLSKPMDQIPFKDIVWLNKPGPGGGGGGGGNRMPFPPKKANQPIPVAKPEPTPIPTSRPTDPPPPALDLAAKPNDAAMVIPGSIDTAGDSLSRGPGSGGGYGTGIGTGIGPGNGSGLGPGWGGGTGGGAYQPGNGVTNPEELKSVKPQYTADAMRAKIQGSVVVEAIVLPDGTVGDCRILKSLDSVFGLDQEAIKAAKQWRFRPGRKQGQPVAVIINIQLDFTLR